MPKKPVAKKKATSKPRGEKRVNIKTMKGGMLADKIEVGRDFINSPQTNYIDHRQIHIATPAQFIAEAEKVQAQIAEAKKQHELSPAQARRIETVEGDLKEVIEEAKKDKPNPKNIKDTLTSAAETMERVGKAVEAAQGLGEKMDKVARAIDWGRVASAWARLATLRSRCSTHCRNDASRKIGDSRPSFRPPSSEGLVCYTHPNNPNNSATSARRAT